MSLSALVLMALLRSDFNANNALADLNAFRAQAMKTAADTKTRDAYMAAQKQVKEKALELTKDVKLADVEAPQCLPLAQIYVAGQQWKESIEAAEKFIPSATSPNEKLQADTIAVQSATSLKDVDTIVRHSDVKLTDTREGYTFALIWLRTGPFNMVTEKKGISTSLKIADNLDTQVQAMTTLKEADKKSWTVGFASTVASELADSGDRDGAMKRIDAVLSKVDPAKEGRTLTFLKKQLSLQGQQYPALKFTKGHGTFDEDAMVGKVMIIDFFAHWCGPCIASFPEMEAMYSDLHGKGLEVVGVTKYYGYYGSENREKRDMPQDVEFGKMGDFIKEHKLPWAVMYGDASNFENYGCAAIPYQVVVDKKGIVRKIKVGYDPTHFAEFRKFVEGLLAE